MSQITIPSSRRTTRRVQPQQSDATRAAVVVERTDLNKRVRLELETVQDIVGQVRQEFSQRIEVSRDLQTQIEYNKVQLAELLRQTGEVGSSLGSLGAFVSYYEHKYRHSVAGLECLLTDIQGAEDGVVAFDAFMCEMATGCLAGAEADIRRLSIVREMLAASVEMQASGLQDVQRLSAELQERHREVSAQMLELSLEMEAAIASIAERECRIAELTQEVVEEQQRLAAGGSDKQQLLCSIAAKEGELAEIGRIAAGLDTEHAALTAGQQQHMGELEQQIEEMRARVGVAVARNEALLAELSTLRQCHEQREALREQLLAAAGGKEAALQQARQALSAAQEELRGLQGEEEAVGAERAAAKATRDDAQKHADDAEKAFSGRYEQKTALVDRIFQLKQQECGLTIDIAQANTRRDTLWAQGERCIAVARAREAALREEGEELVREGVERAASVQAALEQVTAAEGEIEELKEAQQRLSATMAEQVSEIKRLDAGIAAAEEQRGRYGGLEDRIKAAEEEKAAAEGRVAGLDVQLRQLQVDLVACSGDPTQQVQAYYPDAALETEVQEAVRLKKEEIEAACRDSELGKTVATMEGNLAELRAGVACKYPGLLEKRVAELERLTRELEEVKVADQLPSPPVLVGANSSRGSAVSAEMFADVSLDIPTKAKVNVGRASLQEDGRVGSVRVGGKRSSAGKTPADGKKKGRRGRRASATKEGMKENIAINTQVPARSSDPTVARLAHRGVPSKPRLLPSAAGRAPVPDWFEDEAFSLR